MFPSDALNKSGLADHFNPGSSKAFQIAPVVGIRASFVSTFMDKRTLLPASPETKNGHHNNDDGNTFRLAL